MMCETLRQAELGGAGGWVGLRSWESPARAAEAALRPGSRASRGRPLESDQY